MSLRDAPEPHPGDGTRKRACANLAPVVFLLWAFFVYWKFLENHPWRYRQWLSMLGELSLTDFYVTVSGLAYISSSLLALLLFMYVVYLVGDRLRSLLKFNSLEGLESFIFSMGLGLAALIAIAFALGLLGLYYRPVVYVLGVAVGLISFPHIVRHARAIPGAIRNLYGTIAEIVDFRRTGPIVAILVLLILFQCLVSLVFSLTPAMDWDSLNYHLNVPNRYVGQHAMSPIQFLLPSYMPHNINLVYTLGILCKDFVLAKNISFAIGIFVILHVYAVTRRWLNDRFAALLAAYVTTFTPDVVHILGLSYIDFGTTLFFMLSVDSVVRWFEDGNRKWLVVAGVFAGLSLGSKYTVSMGLAALAAGVFVLSLLRTKKIDWGAGVDPTLFAAGIFVAMSPWLVRNLVVLGNPVYPLLFSIFGGIDFTGDLQQRWNEYFVSEFGLGRAFADYLLLPWNVTVKGSFDFKNFGSIASPLWLIFLPFTIFVARVRRVILFILGISLACCLMWAFKVQFTRYLFFIYPLLAISTAYSANEGFLKGGYGSRIINATLRIAVAGLLICSAAGIMLPYTVNVMSEYASVVLGNVSKEEFEKRVIVNYEVLDYINRELPRDAKILFLWENRTYYCERDIIADHYFTISTVYELLLSPDQSPEETRRKLTEEYRITHIFENNRMKEWMYMVNGGPYFTNDAQREKYRRSDALYARFRADYCDTVFSSDGVDLLRIN